MTGEYIGPVAAARVLGVHPNTVRNWAAIGVLPSSRLPGSGYLRFRRDDVEALARAWQAPLETTKPAAPG